MAYNTQSDLEQMSDERLREVRREANERFNEIIDAADGDDVTVGFRTERHELLAGACEDILAARRTKRVSITDKERAVLTAIVNDNFQTDPSNPVDVEVWTFSVMDNSGLDPASHGGVVASLVKKGLAGSFEVSAEDRRRGDDDYIWITQAGFDALNS